MSQSSAKAQGTPKVGASNSVAANADETQAVLDAARSQAEKKNAARKKARAAEMVLVEASRQGDQEAFRKLVEKNQGRLFAVAFGMLRDRDDAMDAVQDAFIKAHRKLPDFEGNAAFGTWLYRICVNLCIDRKRSQARRKSVNIEDARERDLSDDTLYAGIDITPVLSGTNPLKNMANDQLGGELGRALATLTDDHRAVLLLREVEGMSYDEIAQTLEIAKGTVMSRLFHARKNMQQQLRPFLGLEDDADLVRRSPGEPAQHTDKKGGS